VRDTGLKRTIRGYVRNLGRMAQGGQPKFYLGHDREVAARRLDKIVELWQIVEELHATGRRPGVAVWDQGNLEVAKALAKGDVPTVKKGDYEAPERYFRRVNDLRDRLGSEVEPASPFLYRTGREDIRDAIEEERGKLGRTSGPTGQTLHQALRAYQGAIEREYRDADDTISDNGKTKVSQIRGILTYVPDLDLGVLDFTATDELFGIFRRRPLSTRYGKPMAKKSCTNYIGELGRFLRWLHLSGEFAWRKPEDYDPIQRNPRELDADVEKEAADIPVWTVAQLRTLNEYATPIERVFLLLGLNCAYGADQAGRLQVSHLHLKDEGLSYIRRVRRKKKSRSIHLLWRQTVDGLRWALERRKSQPSDTDFLLLTEKNQPYWRKTKGGNRSNAIPRVWNDLLKRVLKDHPDFPRLPFNSLRDTSGNMIRRLAGEELASLHLAHKHQSKDENLGRYTNPVRKRHFKAIRVLERKLESIFEAAGPEPWSRRPKCYMGAAKVKKLLDLRAQGVPPREIAERLDISVASVHRLAPSTKSKGGGPLPDHSE
jgi:integrase